MERVRIGLIILLIKALLIGAITYFHLVAFSGQIACVGVNLFLTLLALLLVRPRTPDILLFLYGQAVEFLSFAAWFFIARKLRMQVTVLGDVYERSLNISLDAELAFFIFLAGVFQTVLLYFYRNAVRNDSGWRG